MAERTRTIVVYVGLSSEEYRELRAMREALGLGYRDFLLLGVRRARQRLHQEQARQARAQRREGPREA